MIEELENVENQQDISRVPKHLQPHVWKKGQSGNIMGRPKGKSMKEYVRQYLERMTDEERDEWLEGIPKLDLFKMAEGNPKQDADITSNGKEIATISAEDRAKLDKILNDK